MQSKQGAAVWPGRLPYTDEENRLKPGMTFVWARNITERTVLRVLISGFGLVLLLLGVAGVIALRRTREIQKDAEELVREELVIARLLNEVQVEEAVMTAVLHQLLRDAGPGAQPRLLADLAAAGEAVRHTAVAAEGTVHAQQWRKLDTIVRQFSAAASDALRKNDRSDAAMRNLLSLHDMFVYTVKELVVTSTARASSIDQVLAGRSRNLASQSFGLLALCFLSALICAVLTVRLAANAIRRMEWQASELNQVSWQMIRTQEDTARRFSHELHDELGQSLAAIKANFTAVRHEDFAQRRADCIHLVDDAIANVRELSQLLRPVMLDDFGLDAALRWLAEKFAQRTGLQVEYQSHLQRRLSEEAETHLFRIAQEALTNIARHSGATQVSISVGVRNGRVSMNITDNGRGLAAVDVPRSPSLGMVGMRARARQAGGELTLATRDGGGLAVRVAIPAVFATNDSEQENTNTAGG